VSPSPKPLEFFCDRSLGRYLVPEALRSAGWLIFTMAELYGEGKAKALPDVEWLAEVGRRDLIVLHKDKNIARLRGGKPGPELAALIRAGVRAFCLMSGQMSASDEAARFLRERAEIERIANTRPGPYVFGLYAREMRCLWPPSLESGDER
jgi:hypothetical protein